MRVTQKILGWVEGSGSLGRGHRPWSCPGGSVLGTRPSTSDHSQRSISVWGWQKVFVFCIGIKLYRSSSPSSCRCEKQDAQDKWLANSETAHSGSTWRCSSLTHTHSCPRCAELALPSPVTQLKKQRPWIVSGPSSGSLSWSSSQAVSEVHPPFVPYISKWETWKRKYWFLYQFLTAGGHRGEVTKIREKLSSVYL